MTNTINDFFDLRGPRSLFGFLSGAGKQLAMPTGGFTASWYKPGDHSTVHTDGTRGAEAENMEGRRLAFVLHLTKVLPSLVSLPCSHLLKLSWHGHVMDMLVMDMLWTRPAMLLLLLLLLLL